MDQTQQVTELACPRVGHKAFERSLQVIRLESIDTPEQISQFIRPALCLTDNLGVAYDEGELQRADFLRAQTLFAHKEFINRTFAAHRDLFRVSQCRVYQFQTIIQRTGVPFVFGTFITDSQHNLIDLCLETKQQDKRRAILHRLIRAVCTPASVNKKLSH